MERFYDGCVNSGELGWNFWCSIQKYILNDVCLKKCFNEVEELKSARNLLWCRLKSLTLSNYFSVRFARYVYTDNIFFSYIRYLTDNGSYGTRLSIVLIIRCHKKKKVFLWINAITHTALIIGYFPSPLIHV